ncbi:MAG: transposase [Spirochaetales bacterium]|nr:transposase [Spirochaetales bacterium]
MKNRISEHISLILIIFSLLFIKKSKVFRKFALVVKENQILKRRLHEKNIKIRFNNHDRLFLSELLSEDKKLSRLLTLVKPETVLNKWKQQIKNRWTFNSGRNPGRPPVTKKVKELIIHLKKSNFSWGYLKISGELGKIGIPVSKDTVRRVIQKGRKDGDIPPNGSWKQFITTHINSLFCCDFFTIDTVFNKRIYIFFVMEIRTRMIIQFGVTTNPTMNFVRNQLKGFMFDRDGLKTHLVHDNSGELKWLDYDSLGITGVSITPYSPNMNAYAERFVRSAKNECFDNFIVLNRMQTRNLMRSYINYYNSERPHQGIQNSIPDSTAKPVNGKIKERKVLYGLYTTLYREAG